VTGVQTCALPILPAWLSDMDNEYLLNSVKAIRNKIVARNYQPEDSALIVGLDNFIKNQS